MLFLVMKTLLYFNYMNENPKVIKRFHDYYTKNYTKILDYYLIYYHIRRASRYAKYSLDATSKRELGVGKLDYSHVANFIGDLPYNDFVLFLQYNIMDNMTLLFLNENTNDIKTALYTRFDVSTEWFGEFKSMASVTNRFNTLREFQGECPANNRNVVLLNMNATQLSIMQKKNPGLYNVAMNLHKANIPKEERKKDYKNTTAENITEDIIRLREEVFTQIVALEELKEMAKRYGYDISRPAKNSKEAVQWTYFAYLAAIKQQNGAAMSIGRVSTFFDIYFERDLKNGTITEAEVQEIMDHFVMKLRLVRFLRTPEYDALFSGDPVWVTESIGGMGIDGRTLVTKNSYRIIQTLYNIGPSPEPNLTVLWSTRLPEGFKKYVAQASIDTSSLQYENDDLMRDYWGDDYGIACCVSAMRIGKQMQFFGARANLAKTLLYAINGGVDEKTKKQVTPRFEPIRSEYLEYDEVMQKFDEMQEYVAKTYMNALNIIHYMHDKYAYESIEMALHDRDILRTMACGIAGLSVVADALSAMKYAKVKTIRDEDRNSCRL